MLSEFERGSLVARAVWEFVQRQKQIELVPWVSDMTDDNDPIKVADHYGWKRALAEVETIMTYESKRLSTDV